MKFRNIGIVFLVVLLVLATSSFALAAGKGVPKNPVDTKGQDGNVVRDDEGPVGYEGAEEVGDGFYFLADITALASYSTVWDSDNDIRGWDLNVELTPIWEIGERNFIMLTYNGEYNRSRDYWSDEYGQSSQRNEQWVNEFNGRFRFDFGDNFDYSLAAQAFYTSSFNKDDEAQNFGEGLYDYYDVGAGLDFEARNLSETADATFRTSLQYYSREYPNFESLLYLATGNGPQFEKDYRGVLYEAGFDWINEEGFSWAAKYSVLFKDFVEAKVVDSNGVLGSGDQFDHIHNVNLNTWYTTDVGFLFGLDSTVGAVYSNQNYYDNRRTLTLADDVYTENYNGSVTWRFMPYIAYTFDAFPLTMYASYAYQRTDFDKRQAKDKNGNYIGTTEYDLQDEKSLSARYDINDNWSVLANWTQVMATSNNKDESVYSYDYVVDIYTMGVSFHY